MGDKQKRHKPSNSEPWSDDELRIAIEGYIYMLRLELSGVAFSAEEMAKFLMQGPLSKRNDASIRYRMRNISYIFSNRKLPILKAYSPASGVGSGVRQRIENFLNERSEILFLLAEKYKKKEKTLNTTTLDEVFSRLDYLEKNLPEIKRKSSIGIGHNNPPESIEESSASIEDAKKSIENIRKELNSSSPDIKKLEQGKNVLVKLGLGIATCFIGGGLAYAGEMLLGPSIIDSIEAVVSFIQSFG